MADKSPTSKPKLPPMAAGQRYGRLVAIEFAYRHNPGRHGRTFWKFLCDCGKEHVADMRGVRKGRARSCGCFHKENARTLLRARETQHGMTETPEHNIWMGMIRRCTDPRREEYPKYGGRGIKVCERWRFSFANFFADMGARPTSQHSLDRYPNNDGNYEPGNVRWATSKPQSRNRRSNVLVIYEGQEMTLIEACEHTGLKYSTVHMRIRRGQTPEEAIKGARPRPQAHPPARGL